MRQGQGLGAPTMFVQGFEPDRALVQTFRLGDFWIDTTDDTLNYWAGEVWKPIQ
jgi:hypothetical protein